MSEEKEKPINIHKIQIEKMKERDRFLDTLRPETCFHCRFLYYWKPPKTGGWCVLWAEDRDWKAESCQSGIKKFTRNNI
jgi:hypothetical protein